MISHWKSKCVIVKSSMNYEALAPFTNMHIRAMSHKKTIKFAPVYSCIDLASLIRVLPNQVASEILFAIYAFLVNNDLFYI